ncbi:MAG TPA: hypothetical protein VFB99_18080 [Vicinamibacterales bacterium]|nr:hypothetical protein [Vicinamibacterales bacterium]HZM33797.1 hypothetical protein [Burkholderiales bacterium]
METVDQLALILSLGATCLVAVVNLGWSLWRLLGRNEDATKCIGRFFRTTLTAALLCGSVALGFLVWLVGTLELRAYHHHFAPFVWFIAFLANAAVGAVLAFLGALLLERTSPPNSTVELDARKSSARGSP